MLSVANYPSMSSNTVLYDIGELITNPLRTGIQRVTFEIIRNWPRQLGLVPVMVTESSELIILPGKTFELITKFFSDSGQNHTVEPEQITALARKPVARLGHPEIARCKALFNPEVFLWSPRLHFYERILSEGLSNIFFAIYDALPVCHPELFPRPFVLAFNEYVKLLRLVPNLAFISEATRRDFADRTFHGQKKVGPVVPLGSDGLGVRNPEFSETKNLFTVVGSVEPRKNHLKILEAFEQLWDQAIDIKLTFVGRRGWLTETELQKIQSIQATQPLFRWMSDLSDSEVAANILKSRATIYVSEIEGYGLPPMESLSLGIPVIVSDKIPSVQMIEPLGQIRLWEVNPQAIFKAVLKMLDNDFAAGKYEEIRNLELPTWSNLARKVQEWIGHCP